MILHHRNANLNVRLMSSSNQATAKAWLSLAPSADGWVRYFGSWLGGLDAAQKWLFGTWKRGILGFLNPPGMVCYGKVMWI